MLNSIAIWAWFKVRQEKADNLKATGASKQVDTLTNQLSGLLLNPNNVGEGLNDLGAIEEGSEEEEDDDEDGDEDEDEEEDGIEKEEFIEEVFNNTNTSHKFSTIEKEFVPQAFSHFTYEASKKNFMVVDLQGVLKQNTDGTSVYHLTDPAIHKQKKKKFRSWTFGRTDRGEKGMKAFFRTHQCNNLCKLLGLEERHVSRDSFVDNI